jgi:hypothetical protein
MQRGSRRVAAILAASAALLGACTPDPDESGTASPTTTDATTTSTTTTTLGPVGIHDECPPVEVDPDIPASWPEPLAVVIGVSAMRLDLAGAIDADCFVLATSYSAALDIPIPELGGVTPGSGTELVYTPTGPPTDLDAPDAPWWGEDRVRVCVELAEARQGCTNVDVTVLRPDVAELQSRFGVTTLPQLTSPLTRSGMRDEGVTPGGIARLQDAYAAEWALQLVAQTVELPQVPLELQAACEATGTSIEALIDAGRTLVSDLAALSDLGAVALTTTMGQEPDAGLSTQANQALAAVGTWLDCRL